VDEEPTVDIESPSSEELADARSEARIEMDEALADQPDNLATEARTGRMDETPDRGGTGDDHAARATMRAPAAGARRKKMMLAAAAAPVVLVAVIVLAWKIAGGQRPQAASAEPVAAVASPARSHAHAKAARAAKEPAPAPQAEMVQPVPETETPSAAEAAAAEAAAPTTMPVASPVEQASSAPALVPETAVDVAAEPSNVAPRDQAEADERQADRIEYIPCPSGYSLTCVMKSPSGYLAMINGKSARLGQTINDAKVVDISLKSVEMQLQDGKRFTLGIGQKGGSGGGSSSSQPSQDLP